MKCSKCKSGDVILTLLSDWSKFVCKCSSCGATSIVSIAEDDYEKFSKIVK